MTTNLNALSIQPHTQRPLRRAKWAGWAFVGSWVVGLTAFGRGPSAGASDTSIADYFAEHRLATAGQALFAHGAAALALLVVIRAAKQNNRGTTAAHLAGMSAVTLSLSQLTLDLIRSLITTGTTTASLVHTVDRIDGFKLLALALMIGANIEHFRSTNLIGRPMVVVGSAGTASLTVAGITFVAGLDAATLVAVPALLLLLAWVAGIGVALDRTDSNAAALT